jgi:hypothetical protein
MARITYIQDPDTLRLIPKDEYYDRTELNAPMIMGDIKPYKSMVTGEEITSRSKHREHLRQHGMVEIGNELKHLQPKPKQDDSSRVKELVARQVYEKLRY